MLVEIKVVSITDHNRYELCASKHEGRSIRESVLEIHARLVRWGSLSRPSVLSNGRDPFFHSTVSSHRYKHETCLPAI